MCSKATLNYWEADEQFLEEGAWKAFYWQWDLSELLPFIVVLFGGNSVGAQPNIPVRF